MPPCIFASCSSSLPLIIVSWFFNTWHKPCLTSEFHGSMFIRSHIVSLHTALMDPKDQHWMIMWRLKKVEFSYIKNQENWRTMHFLVFWNWQVEFQLLSKKRHKSGANISKLVSPEYGEPRVRFHCKNWNLPETGSPDCSSHRYLSFRPSSGGRAVLLVLWTRHEVLWLTRWRMVLLMV